MTFLYTLTGATRKQKEKEKFSLLKCIQKSNVMKKIIWVLVFGIMYLFLVYPMTRSLNSCNSNAKIGEEFQNNYVT